MMRRPNLRTSVAGGGMLACICLIAAVGGVSGVTNVDSDEPTHGTQADVAANATGTAQVLPPIGQWGTDAAPAAAAKTTLEFTLDPVKPGAKTTVVRRPIKSDGTLGKREVFATLKQGLLGTVHVNVKPVDEQGRPSLYFARSGDRRTKSIRSDATPWDLGFDDEFSGTSFDSDTWRTRPSANAAANVDQNGNVKCTPGDMTGATSVSRSRNFHSDRSVVVRGGVASLLVRRVAECGSGAEWRAVHETGHIGTEPKSGFGGATIGGDGGTYVVAARMRLSETSGNYGGFWTRAVTGGPQDDVNEIDVIESFGKGHPPNCAPKSGAMRVIPADGAVASMTSNVYRAYSPHEGIKACLGTSNLRGIYRPQVKPWEAYRVYSVEWGPAGYKFRIDGELTRVLRPEDFSPTYAGRHRTFLLLSNNVQDMCGAPSKRVGCKPDVKNPNSALRVDWIRTWKSR